jgi:type VI secretion system secreted protein VgrG
VAGQHLHWTSQTDLHLVGAHTLASVAGGATTLFTHSGGIQAIAANGPVSLQAHTAPLEILADQAITVTSVNGNIEIKAQQKIVVQAGSSSITLEGSNITLACPGKISVKGAVHGFKGAATGEVGLEVLPSGAVGAVGFIAPSVPASDTEVKMLDEAFILKSEFTGKPLAHRRYRIIRENGTMEEGVTNEQGMTHLVKSDRLETLQVEIGEEEIA